MQAVYVLCVLYLLNKSLTAATSFLQRFCFTSSIIISAQTNVVRNFVAF